MLTKQEEYKIAVQLAQEYADVKGGRLVYCTQHLDNSLVVNDQNEVEIVYQYNARMFVKDMIEIRDADHARSLGVQPHVIYDEETDTSRLGWPSFFIIDVEIDFPFTSEHIRNGSLQEVIDYYKGKDDHAT